jgi:hypothetical protein
MSPPADGSLIAKHLILCAGVHRNPETGEVTPEGVVIRVRPDPARPDAPFVLDRPTVFSWLAATRKGEYRLKLVVVSGNSHHVLAGLETDVAFPGPGAEQIVLITSDGGLDFQAPGGYLVELWWLKAEGEWRFLRDWPVDVLNPNP